MTYKKRLINTLYKKLYKQKINNNYALLCDLDNKCNLSMVKFKANPVRFIEFDIYL